MYWNECRENSFNFLSDYLACTANREQHPDVYDAVRDMLTALSDSMLELAHTHRDIEELEATVEELENCDWVEDDEED